LDNKHSCAVVLHAEYNLLFLVDDSGNFWLPALTAGVPGSVSNGQCTLNAGSSSVMRNGSSLSATFHLTFSGGLAGSRDIYGNALDRGGAWSGWKKIGTWSVGGQLPPSVTSLSPASGSGGSQSFSLTVADPNGQGDLQYAFLLIGNPDNKYACSVVLHAEYNLLFLVDDSGAFWLPAVTAGSAATVSNSQCTLNAAGSTVTRGGSSLTATFHLTFTGAMAGTRDIYANALDRAGLWNGWKKMGTWTVGGQQPPSVSALTPASGGGAAQSFAVAATDPNGHSDLQYVFFLLGSLDNQPACSVVLHAEYNLLFLVDDSGTFWLSPLTVGSPGTISNGRCTLNGGASSVSRGGSTLSATLALTLSGGISGTRDLYGNAMDRGGLWSGWKKMGTWTVP
ncbi:MAG: hypothetical protein IT429_13375, partial [Gemmataceae bacterium]|nr:hypothetical protein [Gemmataceae bacterium]